MAKYSWATDIHLDFLDFEQQLIAFAQSLIVDNPTGIILTGDISTASKLVYHLSVIERVVQRPIYYVLGNHDYYGGRIEDVRKVMKEVTNMSQFLKYMPTLPYIGLSPSTAIIGHDGWYDALYGDWKNSRFMMNDWESIGDFLPHSGGRAGVKSLGSGNFDRGSIVGLCQKLAHEATTHVMNGIKTAVRYHKNLIILTHVPPFEEAHVYNGAPGDAHHQPWFTSKMMGDMLRQAAATYPKVNFTVFAGHTHGKADVSIAKNLTCHVGDAEYHFPKMQSLIEV